MLEIDNGVGAGSERNGPWARAASAGKIGGVDAVNVSQRKKSIR